MGQLFAVEVIYRGVFQKTLAKNITRGIVFAAHNEGKLGISFGRYGDAPERNGIPAKSFAIVANDEQTLEAGMAQYEPKQVDLTVVLDDTLCKGAESWAWYGLQPVHHALKPGHTLIVISLEDAPALLKNIHRREQPYKLGIVKGVTSFSGMWVYKDDHTDVRILGAIAKALPEVMSLESVEKFINEKLKSPLKVTSARTAFERFTSDRGEGGRGQSRRAVQVRSAPLGRHALRRIHQGSAARRPVRRSGHRESRRLPAGPQRAVQEVLDAHPAAGGELLHLHQVHAVLAELPGCVFRRHPGREPTTPISKSCCGCGICEEVCPVKNCVTMVNESEFHDNNSQWAAFKKDKDAYLKWLETTIKKAEPIEKRSHGFRYRGQYQEQVPEALEIATKG